MFSVVVDSIQLFITGRLFRDYKQVFIRSALAMVIGALVLVLFGMAVSPIFGVVAGGATGGFLLPLLFKNLKYQ